MAKKKKIKKFLKNVAPLIAAGLGAAALGKRANRKASIDNNMAKEFGFGQMKLKDYGPYSSKSVTRFVKPKMLNANELAIDLMDPNLNTGDGLGILDMKKGGRVKKRTGAAKRGFGRAFKGGKK